MWRLLSNKLGKSPRASETTFLSEPEFSLCLAKERARADRDGTTFLLVVIDLGEATNGHGMALAMLDDVLGERTRLQDTRGTYKGKVRLILVGALPDMLGAFWADIEHRFRTRWRKEQGQQLPLPRLSYEVYVYPGDSQLIVNKSVSEPRNGRQKPPEGHRTLGK